MQLFSAFAAIAACVIALAGSAASVQAKPCTSIPSITTSHFIETNNEYGGHLNAHIFEQTPPAHYSQKGKTLFSSSDDWYKAYDELAAEKPGLQCDVGAMVGAKAVQTRKLPLTSEECTAAEKDGRCKAYHTVETEYVTYVMKVVQGDDSPRWIVYTAYPLR
jgi:hypothetical protein